MFVSTYQKVVVQTCLLIISVQLSWASIPCQDDGMCVEKYRTGSKCVAGLCSNPFESGCLHRYLGADKFSKLRVCNSNDPPNAAESKICLNSPFDYDEIRILSGNWESSMLLAWVMQIVLSELAGVPSTIESGSPERNFNFYDSKNSFDFGTMLYDYDALRTAYKYSDCRKSPSDQSCAHVLPEIWNGQNLLVSQAEKEGFIESKVGNGAVGKLAWYIPSYTAKKDPTLLSIFGLTETANTTDTKSNRQKLADTFKRPFNWKDYCELFTTDNCTTPDDIAQRAPETSSECAKFFVSGIFNGKFNGTDENDCNANPSTCTGHIVAPDCKWASYVHQQAYHLKIPVKSNGPSPTGSYSYSEQLDVLQAAFATKSDILFIWFAPDPTLQSHIGTENELQKVLLTTPTQECLESRVSVEDKCSKDPSKWIGEFEGSCDNVAHSLNKLIVSNLYENGLKDDKTLDSPGYHTVKSISISDIELEQIFDSWNMTPGIDQDGYDPREAVCQWVAQNIPKLKEAIPRTHPRTMRLSDYNQNYIYAAMVVGIVSMLLVTLCFISIWYYQEKEVIVNAQCVILYMLLAGLMFMSISAVVYATNPSKTTCVLREWCLILGYSLELVPLFVKVAAINKICQSAAKLKRVKITPRDLYKTIGQVVGVIIVFLILWTVIDPLMRQEERLLTSDENLDGGIYIDIYYKCASSSLAWKLISLSIHMIFLLCSTVLAFQSRNVRQDYNESSKLAFVIYAQFLFFLLRAMTWVFSSQFIPGVSLIPSVSDAITSFILSFDVIVMLIIYFIPKIIIGRKIKPPDSNERNARTRVSTNVWSNTIELQDTANVLILREVNGIAETSLHDIAHKNSESLGFTKKSEEGKVIDETFDAMRKVLKKIKTLTRY